MTPIIVPTKLGAISWGFVQAPTKLKPKDKHYTCELNFSIFKSYFSLPVRANADVVRMVMDVVS